MTRTFYKFLSLVISSGLSLCSIAQEIEIEGTVSGIDPHSSLLLISPMGGNRNDTLHLKELDAEKQYWQIKGKVLQSADSLYQLMGIIEGRQLLQPLRIIPGEKLHLSIEGSNINCNTSTDNSILCAFGNTHLNITKKLWNEGMEMSATELEQLLGQFQKETETLTRSSSCSPTIQRYLYMWAYISMKSQYNNLAFITKRKDILKQIPLDSEVLWADGMGKKPHRILDNAMALYFYQTPQLIVHDLPSGTVEEKMKALYDNYHCQQIREQVTSLLIEEYIKHFDYSNQFSEGLITINKLTETYQLDKKYHQLFAMRRYSNPGSLFPEEVSLVDSTDTPVDFSAFRGKYVYIDFWASWCKPCIGEIPHLQHLERELSGREDIVFVSISIDQNKTAWRNKMRELNLHGIQLHDESTKLGKFLNISSIPHFIIYDKEGRLLKYNAARPSSQNILKDYLESLP